jgi:hypothetical protein
VAVVIGIFEAVVAAVLFQAEFERQAGVALTLGLWMLGRSLARSE